MSRALFIVAPFMALAPALAEAQGRTDYFNVESPQVKPITIARVGGHDYLLICNTPDNSLEVWDTDENITNTALRFIARIPVGLEPVSVTWDPTLSRAYTANFLGDSISMIALATGSSGLSYAQAMTFDVGDEPMDVTVAGSTLYVTHSTTGTYGLRSASTLLPVSTSPDTSHLDPNVPGVAATVTVFVMGHDVEVPVVQEWGLKEPRTVRVSNGKLFVLGTKGGHTPLKYDFDIFVRDLTTDAVSLIDSLGSTNMNMTFDSTGDLWVVGGEARNDTTDNLSEPEVADDPTGFVMSTIYLVEDPDTSTPTITRRDLNDVDGTAKPVDPSDALAQPTDVVVFDDGETRKVYIAAFGSDRVGVLTVGSTSTPYAWPLDRIAIPVATGSTNPLSGPRGLAVKYANVPDELDPGDRIYVLNRLDNSFSIIDPSSDTCLDTIALANDPTPDYIRTGREFLYSAKLSGNGFVSCASCHVDARTDSFTWKLGTPGVTPVRYPAAMVDGIEPVDYFAEDKGAMVTQTLQGLLNYEIEPGNRDLFTNAPYHWRADRADFLAFAGAFEGLLGADEPLDVEFMEEFETFVNSIHYPPNPYEPFNRVYSGTVYEDPEEQDPADLNDEAVGEDAQLGLKLFHITGLSTCSGRSCVQCHALPESSNNRGTVPSSDLIETAQTRGLFQREMRQDRMADDDPSAVVTAEFGLTHLGLTASLNGFINRFQAATVPGTTADAFTPTGLLAVKQFMREFDWGVAPLVGNAYTVDKFNKTSTLTSNTLIGLERQVALANIGLAVYARIGGVETGYWFDLTASPPAYRIEGSSPASWVSRATLAGSPTQLRDRVIFQATPLGSDRRVASLSGTATLVTSSASPSGIELMPLVANTAHAQIPGFVKNWDPNHATTSMQFVWTQPTIDPPPFAKAIRFMQYGILSCATDLGLPELRHEAPRRFAVAGYDIVPGAKLHLFVPNDTSEPSAHGVGTLGQITTMELVFPIFPTYPLLEDDRQVWQTAVEVEPYIAYMLMLGGPLAPGMPAVLDPLQVTAEANEPPTSSSFAFNPDKYNWHYVRVVNPVNPSTNYGDGGWQRLRLQ